MSLSQKLDALLGKHVQITLTALTLTSGAWVEGNSWDLIGVLDEASDKIDIEIENIPSFDSYMQNPTPVGFGGGYTLTEINQRRAMPSSVSGLSTTTGNSLRAALLASLYFKVVFRLMTANSPASGGILHGVSGATVSIQTQTAYCICTGLDGSQPRGKGTTTANFQFMDTVDSSTGARLEPVFTTVA